MIINSYEKPLDKTFLFKYGHDAKPPWGVDTGQ